MLLSFKDFINEMSIAKFGNMDNPRLIDAELVESTTTKVGSIKSKENEHFDILKIKNIQRYRIGKFIQDTTERKFMEIGMIELEMIPSFLNYHNLVRVDNVTISNSHQNKGIAKELYKFLVYELKFTVVGDLAQYFGARQLWSSLSRDNTVSVDIIDVKSKTVLETNVNLKKEFNDSVDFDERVWTKDSDDNFKSNKINVRLVLRQNK